MLSFLKCLCDKYETEKWDHASNSLKKLSRNCPRCAGCFRISDYLVIVFRAPSAYTEWKMGEGYRLFCLAKVPDVPVQSALKTLLGMFCEIVNFLVYFLVAGFCDTLLLSPFISEFTQIRSFISERFQKSWERLSELDRKKNVLALQV